MFKNLKNGWSCAWDETVRHIIKPKTLIKQNTLEEIEASKINKKLVNFRPQHTSTR